MRFGRRIQEEADTIQMAPLIDIVFLTLIFFMVTSVYSTLEREVDIKLPTADTGRQEQRTPGEIFINVRTGGSIVVNNREMKIDELQAVLDRVAEYFPGGAVIIRGDRGVALGQIIAVLDCCRKADIQDISFAVTKETPPGDAPK
ncbi:MAG TPA: biopolymer transporter ExbD [Candidatus Hydrogenedentes bacterium]|nr:biopolymer transporter ExbD [Candidatus Hydrogenedentota bacterium]